jgi:hypothetical protein
MRNTLYVVVDASLESYGLKAAQAGHAIAKFCLEDP